MDQHSITQSVFDRIIAFLAKLFLPTCDNDRDRARDAVLEALAEYDPRTNRELRLAALSLAFSLGALDALSRAVDEDLTLNQVLRLRSSANALHRSARHAEEALAEEREAPGEQDAAEEGPEEGPEDAASSEAPLPPSTEPDDLAAFARNSPTLSRQQRRKQAREAARRQRRQQEQARQAKRHAQRAMQPDDGALIVPLPHPATLPAEGLPRSVAAQTA